jgi:hypothetical protein
MNPAEAVTFASATYKTKGGRVRSADTRPALALRGLQMLDQMQRDRQRSALERATLYRCMDSLGACLFIACTGTGSPDEGYEHNGDTCPVHEWLVPDDYDASDIPGDA